MKRLSRPPSSAADHDSVRQAVAQDLRSRYEAQRKAKQKAGQDQVDKYTKMAEVAQESGDWASAVNALRTALELSPEDRELERRFVALQTQADRVLAPRFTEQARSEEKDARYLQAARSYERAARGKKSAELYEKSAHCYLKDGGLGDSDVRKLVEMARQAVNLDNDSAAYRVTLARAYYTAGMKSSAQGEVGRALSLEPDNNNAKQLQKLLK
jgi:tetratricopeptide (TPR) repeat protein